MAQLVITSVDKVTNNRITGAGYKIYYQPFDDNENNSSDKTLLLETRNGEACLTLLFNENGNNSSSLSCTDKFENKTNGLYESFEGVRLQEGVYIIEEIEPPISRISFEDENAKEFTQIQNYEISPITKIEYKKGVSDNLNVEIKHTPTYVEYDETVDDRTLELQEVDEENKFKLLVHKISNFLNKNSKSKISTKEKEHLYARDHILTPIELKKILKHEGIRYLGFTLLFFWLGFPFLLTSLFCIKASSLAGSNYISANLSVYFSKYFFRGYQAIYELNTSNADCAISANFIFFLALSFIFLFFGLFLKKILWLAKPTNRILDNAPRPIKKGVNVGIHGTADIVEDKKEVLRTFSFVSDLDNKLLDDPGAYCGYYPPPSIYRYLDIPKKKIVDMVNEKSKNKQIQYKQKNGTYVFVPDDNHTIVYGDTRAGKTRRFLLSTIHLLCRGKKESLILFDAKRELLSFTSQKLEKEGYQIIVYDFEHPERSTRHNPLYVAINYAKQGEDALASSEVAERVDALMNPNVKEGDNTYFYINAAALIKAVALAVIYDDNCPEDQKTFNTVSRIIEKMIIKRPVDIKKPNIKYSPFEEYIQMFPKGHIVHEAFAPLAEVEDKYMYNFVSTAQTLLSIFRDPAIAEMTSVTDNPFDQIAMKKQAVFIIAPATKQAFSSLATMFLDQMYSELRGAAQADKKIGNTQIRGRTYLRVNVIGEEILSINPWKKLPDALNESAGLGIRFFLIINNQMLFNQKYGDAVAKGLNPNCATQMLITTGDEDATVRLWSSYIGTTTVEEKSVNISGSRFGFKKNKTVSTKATKRERLNKNEILGWNADCGLLIKTKLHRHVVCVPLPDLSCTPTEKFFDLGSKEYNLKKCSDVQKIDFREKTKIENVKSKTVWLPGINNAQNKKFTNNVIDKMLQEQEKQYIKQFIDRNATTNEKTTFNVGQKQSKFCCGAFLNTKSHEIIRKNSIEEFMDALASGEFKAEQWISKPFRSYDDLKTYCFKFLQKRTEDSIRNQEIYIDE